jgi:hypothetical protein
MYARPLFVVVGILGLVLARFCTLGGDFPENGALASLGSIGYTLAG